MVGGVQSSQQGQINSLVTDKKIQIDDSGSSNSGPGGVSSGNGPNTTSGANSPPPPQQVVPTSAGAESNTRSPSERALEQMAQLNSFMTSVRNQSTPGGGASYDSLKNDMNSSLDKLENSLDALKKSGQGSSEDEVYKDVKAAYERLENDVKSFLREVRNSERSAPPSSAAKPAEDPSGSQPPAAPAAHAALPAPADEAAAKATVASHSPARRPTNAAGAPPGQANEPSNAPEKAPGVANRPENPVKAAPGSANRPENPFKAAPGLANRPANFAKSVPGLSKKGLAGIDRASGLLRKLIDSEDPSGALAKIREGVQDLLKELRTEYAKSPKLRQQIREESQKTLLSVPEERGDFEPGMVGSLKEGAKIILDEAPASARLEIQKDLISALSLNPPLESIPESNTERGNGAFVNIFA